MKGTDWKLPIGQDAMFSLGVRHDNVGRYAVTFAVGARIAVCSNGVFSGDFVLKNRHYDSLNLDDAVAEGVERYLTETDTLIKFIQNMQAVTLDDRDASHLLVSTAERMSGNDHGCINWNHLRSVWENWKTPPHDEFQPRNQWSLYNAFTQVGKELSPPRQMSLLKGLKPLMEKHGDYAPKEN
jgi:hypothetical protein